MKVIVDTCIWSMAFRRSMEIDNSIVKKLHELIKEYKVQMIGPIRQELLSGIKSEKQFNMLRKSLKVFPDLELRTDDYETAAEFFNQCRNNGIQGSNTDFLICSVSIHRNMPIFTFDEDFQHFQKVIPIQLYPHE